MNNNGRPLPMRKQVQFLIALTILAWATQTLFAQWSRGAEVTAPGSVAAQTPSFVPRDGVLRGGTIELRAEARVYGADLKLKQVCRWSEADAAMFAPVADLVLAKLETRRPYKVIDVGEIRQMLEDAGLNVALVRFSGPTECTAARADAELKEGEALEQWVKARQRGQDDAPPPEAKPAPDVASVARPEPIARLASDTESDDAEVRTLRGTLAADLAVRLSVPEEQLVLTFDPRDEGTLNLREPQFKFNVEPRRARDLGEVAWDVTLVSGAGDSRRVPIRATARAWQHQVVTARPLNRRQQIMEADVAARRTLVDRLPDAALLKQEQVVGQMAGRDLKPGTVMTAQLVEAVPLAKVGQFITVTLERGSVRIKSVGKALEGGSYGETIRVKNEGTKDVYQVILTGPQEGSVAPVAAPGAGDEGVASARNGS